MPRLICWYSGICWYLANSSCHSASFSGGMTPWIGFHSVIDRPEWVRRVAPPTTTIATIIAAHQQPRAHLRTIAPLVTDRRRCDDWACFRGGRHRFPLCRPFDIARRRRPQATQPSDERRLRKARECPPGSGRLSATALLLVFIPAYALFVMTIAGARLPGHVGADPDAVFRRRGSALGRPRRRDHRVDAKVRHKADARRLHPRRCVSWRIVSSSDAAAPGDPPPAA